MSELADIRDQLGRLNHQLDRVERHITGASEPERGIIMRLDRVEQTHKRGDWWAKTAMGVAVTTLVGGLMALFQKAKEG